MSPNAPIGRPPVASVAEDTPNRRSANRSRTYKAGKIISLNFAMTFDCLVRDMSPSGARLAIDSVLGLPAEFFFFLPGDRLVARARIAWRAPAQVGIQFLEALVPPKEHPTPGLAKVTI